MSKLFQADNYLSDAPCYWRLTNDGAMYRCSSCHELGVYSEMLYYLTPNGNRGIAHVSCLDADWLDNAKCMAEKL